VKESDQNVVLDVKSKEETAVKGDADLSTLDKGLAGF
jgi:hypothetical protein